MRPTGSIVNIPLYDWRAIFTTNYDTLIEQSYEIRKRELTVYRSNFDFSPRGDHTETKLFKIHGSIDQDIVDGHQSRIIISAEDYDLAEKYREQLYDTLTLNATTANLLIIGHSFSDPDLKIVIDEALKRKREAKLQGKIYLLLYTKDENRSIIYESRGVIVCYGGLDEFFNEFSNKEKQPELSLALSDNPLDCVSSLRSTTTEVSHAIQHSTRDASRMFNGSPASYSDIQSGLTFEREVANQIEALLAQGEAPLVYLLGAAGAGKSTAARQVLTRLSHRGILCWEHKDDYRLSADKWQQVNSELIKRNQTGLLFIDDCHGHMHEVNKLVDGIVGKEGSALKLLLVSSKHAWNPRLKTAGIFTFGKGFTLNQLTKHEIVGLIDLLDREKEIKKLVEDTFLGFSRSERIRRLQERCSSDMFVCLKNLFSSDAIDNILLREYAELSDINQDIYRTVSAMESAGVRVHRQLVIRALGVAATSIAGILDGMSDIITEYSISEKEGIYSWRIRHGVVADIIAKYKYSDPDEAFALFEKIIDNLIPTYDIEIRTMRDICDMKGIGKLPTKEKQNQLFRKMISNAPGQRVPRHRLISNLLDLESFDQAETEIKIYERELRADSPIQRYKIYLLLRRAQHTPGLLIEDRAALILQAADFAEKGISLYKDDKNIYRSYCEVGLAYLRTTGKWSVYDDAMEEIKGLEERIQDPDITRIIGKIESIAHGYSKPKDKASAANG